MTLPRLYEMQRYWLTHPPVGDLVAAYLGYKAPSVGAEGRSSPVGRASGGAGVSPANRYGSAEELMAEFAACGGRMI